jgi:tetratricopeptide (TPR) repeat protein
MNKKHYLANYKLTYGFIILATILISAFAINVYAFSLADAQKDYLSGRYDEAIEKAKKLRQSDDVLYFLGLVHLKIEDYQKAKGYFRELTTHFPNSRYYNLGMIKLADIYFLKEDYANAKTIYSDLEKSPLVPDRMPLVLLRLAQIASHEGNWEENEKYLKLLNEKYPGSPEMKIADTLKDYGDFFTIQIGAFSEKSNALCLFNELKAKYDDAYISENGKSSQPIYKVRIGKFKKRYDVEKLANQLKKEGYAVKIFP